MYDISPYSPVQVRLPDPYLCVLQAGFFPVLHSYPEDGGYMFLCILCLYSPDYRPFHRITQSPSQLPQCGPLCPNVLSKTKLEELELMLCHLKGYYKHNFQWIVNFCRKYISRPSKGARNSSRPTARRDVSVPGLWRAEWLKFGSRNNFPSSQQQDSGPDYSILHSLVILFRWQSLQESLDLMGNVTLPASCTKYLIDYTVAKLRSSIILRQNVINTHEEMWTSSTRNRINGSHKLSNALKTFLVV
jgi:hypothetical protein